MIAVRILIWFLLGLQIYTFAGYPLIVFIIAKFKRNKKCNQGIPYEPFVTFVIPARNEEKVIADKIKNTLGLSYPSEKIEIIVGSDYSTDKTDQIVRSYDSESVKLIAFQKRRGKTYIQNLAVSEMAGEIIVFSDANALYDKNAVRHLVQHFRDPDVGCVSGALCYSNPKKSLAGREENLYWKYEKFLKMNEEKAGTILGANGSIYAVRKTHYVPLQGEIISDFIEPLEIAVRGKRVVYEPDALSFENVSNTFREELLRKRRILSRSIYSLFVHKHLLNPFHSRKVWIGLVSHKILRWFSPCFLILLFLFCGLMIHDSLYRFLFILQTVFYITGVLGILLKNIRGLPTLFLAPYYFCLLGYASLLGISDFIRGKHKVVWEPLRP